MPPLLPGLDSIHRPNVHESLQLLKCCLLLAVAKKLVTLTKMVVVCNSLWRQLWSSLLALRSIFKATHLCKRKLLCSSNYEMFTLTWICSRPIAVGLQSGWGETISEEQPQILDTQDPGRQKLCVWGCFFPRSCYKQLWKSRLVIFTSHSCNLYVSLYHSSQECALAPSDHLDTTGFFPGSISTDGNMFITLTVVPNTMTVCLSLKQSREYYIAC